MRIGIMKNMNRSLRTAILALIVSIVPAQLFALHATLARGLHASVELNQQIPEHFFGAVAALLAFVYRTAARRAAA